MKKGFKDMSLKEKIGEVALCISGWIFAWYATRWSMTEYGGITGAALVVASGIVFYVYIFNFKSFVPDENGQKKPLYLVMTGGEVWFFYGLTVALIISLFYIAMIPI